MFEISLFIKLSIQYLKMTAPGSSLTAEQKKMIEEQRAKALKLRAEVMARRAKEQQDALKSNIDSVNGAKDKPNIINVEKQSTGRIIPKSIQPSNKMPTNHNKLTGTCTLISRQRFMIDVGFHQKMIELFKNIPSRSYDATAKKWNFVIQDHDKLMKDLQSLKDEINILPLPSFVIKTFINASKTKNIDEVDLTSLEPGLVHALYPFQAEGIRFVISKGGRALIADDMGLGKTIQAIGVASYYRQDWPLLVITPSSMRYSWLEAIRRWMPTLEPSTIIVADNSNDQFGKVAVLIISYDLLARKADYIKMRNFGVVIVDESHFMKNYKTSRTKAILPLLKQAKRAILLSGTPALSRPSELYTQISAINPSVFPSFHEFGVRYCAARKMAWGWDYGGATNMTELQFIMEETVLIRRLKSDVLRDLPAKQREMVVLDPDKIDHHKSMNVAAVKWVDKSVKGMEKRGALLQYFHETGSAKMRAVSEYVIDQVESGKKFLCFVHHDVVMNTICDHLNKQKIQYIRIDGKTLSQERKVLCDKFQCSDACRVAILSITAANMGLTLTAAQFVLFGELFWNPGVLSQAEDRCHRIGQKNSVVIQYLVAKQTADDYLWPLVQRKLDVLNKAGLSKDDFQDVDLKIMEKSKSRTLDDFGYLEDFEIDEIAAPNIKKPKL